MSLNIAIDDERALSREMFVLGMGGVTAGLTAGALSLVTGEYVAQLMILTFAAVIGLFANYTDRLRERGHFRLGLSVLAGIVWALLLPLGAVWAGVAGGAMLGAVLYGTGSGGEKTKSVARVGVSGLYGVVLGLAVFTTETFVTQGFLSEMTHTIVPEIVMGGTWGIFLCAAALIPRVEFKRDLIIADYNAAIAEAGPGGRAVLSQGLNVYSRLMAEFDRSEDRGFVEAARPVAEEVAKSMLVLAHKTEALRRSNVADDFVDLEARIARTDDQLRAAEDGALRRELSGVREELEAQLCARKELRATCSRFEARQHRCITSLERLQIALIQNSTMGMEHFDLKDALSSLQELAEEIRWRGGWDIQAGVESGKSGLIEEDVEMKSGVEIVELS